MKNCPVTSWRRAWILLCGFFLSSMCGPTCVVPAAACRCVGRRPRKTGLLRRNRARDSPLPLWVHIGRLCPSCSPYPWLIFKWAAGGRRGNAVFEKPTTCWQSFQAACAISLCLSGKPAFLPAPKHSRQPSPRLTYICKLSRRAVSSIVTWTWAFISSCLQF